MFKFAVHVLFMGGGSISKYACKKMKEKSRVDDARLVIVFSALSTAMLN